jgi:ABC-type dipeptide/oligopeptide/nickel transport system ATPase component
VLVMKDGEIVESGSVREVLDAPRHPYTQILVAQVGAVSAGVPELVLAK